jgi:magnesium and cobalt exporter, CNNM family
LSFFVSGSEVAFFSLGNRDINVLKTRQQPSYKRIIRLLENPKNLLASMLIANSLINIGIILISNSLLNTWAVTLHVHFIVEFIGKVVIITAVLVIFCEVLPKVWATNHKIWFASVSSFIVEIFYRLLFPVSRRLVNLSDSIERTFHSKSPGMDDTQLDYAIDLLPEHEASNEEKQILKGIRKFGNTTVKQTMRTRLDVSGIEFNTSFTDVKRKVEEMHYSRIPIYKNNLDEIAGILHTKDLLPYLDEQEFDWHSLMRPVFYVHEQKLIEDILQDFRNRRIHFAVVVDEFGGTSGIITLEDVMEEIIGDIHDEFDDEQSINKKLDDYNYIFEGKTMINDVCKIVHLPTDTFNKIRGDSDSLAGLILEIAGEFPEINKPLTWEDYTFVPLAINKNRIEKVKLTLKKKDNE